MIHEMIEPFLIKRWNKKSNEDIRILLYGHYRIAYLLKEGGDIDILGVFFHGSLDIQRFLKK